jgi:outer membrane autotransporter protein
LNTHGWGLLASLETGRKFEFTPQWSLTPEAQVIYQAVRLDSGQDAFGQISFGADRAVYGRIGAKLSKTWDLGDDADPHFLTTWLRANLWRSFGSGASTTFAALDGSNPVRLGQALGGSRSQIGLGASGQISRSTSLFAEADYGFGVGDSKTISWSGRGGIQYFW